MRKVTFIVRPKPCGVSVLKTVGERVQRKFFRNGYAGAIHTADKWIHEQIDGYREESICSDVAMPEIEVIGHTLSRRKPKTSDLVRMIRRLVNELGNHCDTGDINSIAGRLCEEAENLIQYT